MNNRKAFGKVKPAYLIGALLILIFGAVGMVGFIEGSVPYVHIEDARLGTYCQVKGDVNHPSRHYDPKKKRNVFYLEDEEGDRLRVEYRRPLPANFDMVRQVVVAGRYKNGAFEADDVLTK